MSSSRTCCGCSRASRSSVAGRKCALPPWRDFPDEEFLIEPKGLCVQSSSRKHSICWNSVTKTSRRPGMADRIAPFAGHNRHRQQNPQNMTEGEIPWRYQFVVAAISYQCETVAFVLDFQSRLISHERFSRSSAYPRSNKSSGCYRVTQCARPTSHERVAL